MRESERTLKMKEQYLELFQQGMTPKEIATMFDLDPSTIYRCLGTIAKTMGVERSELLKRPTSQHGIHNKILKPLKPVDELDFDENDFDNTINGITSLQEKMKITLKEFEKRGRRLEREDEKWK